jgi:hypothetical protein
MLSPVTTLHGMDSQNENVPIVKNMENEGTTTMTNFVVQLKQSISHPDDAGYSNQVSTGASETTLFSNSTPITQVRIQDYTEISKTTKEFNNTTFSSDMFANVTKIMPDASNLFGPLISDHIPVLFNNQTEENGLSVTYVRPSENKTLNNTLENSEVNKPSLLTTSTPLPSTPQNHDKSDMNQSSTEESLKKLDNIATISSNIVMENANDTHFGTSKRDVHNLIANTGFPTMDIVTNKAVGKPLDTTIPVSEVSGERKPVTSNFISDETLDDFNIFSKFLDMLKP